MSLAVGPLFVRLRSDYFALVNLALAVIIFYLMQKVLAPITHGDNGLWFLTNMTPRPCSTSPGRTSSSSSRCCVAFAVWAFYKYLDDTLYGACCLATKVNEDKLTFLGYSNFNIRLLAFVIANTTTALAGALYAIYLGFVSPEMTSAGPRRRSGRGDDPRRRRHALRTDRRLDRLHRHEGPDQQG